MPALSQFAQTDQTPPAPAPAFQIDLSSLSNGIWTALSSHMNELGTSAWTGFSQWLYSLLRGLFLGIWNASLLPIPHGVTDQFAPVHAIFEASVPIATAGVVLAVVLLGVRTLVRGITGHGGVLDEVMGRLLVYVCSLSMLPFIVSHAIDIEQSIARGVAVTNVEAFLPEHSGANPIALVAMIFFGLKLWLKLASNVVHVAVAVAWSPVALMCGLIPEGAWIASLWTREFLGRLAGAALAAIASGLGLAIALTNAGGGGGDFAIFGCAGAFMAAADLVDWLAKTPGSSMGGFVGAGLRFGMGLVGGGGGTAAAAAIPANQLTPSAEIFGYD